MKTKPHIAKALLYEEAHQKYQIKQAFLKIHNQKRTQRKPLPLALYGVVALALMMIFL